MIFKWLVLHVSYLIFHVKVTQPAGITLESDHPSLVITQRTVQPMISGVSNFLAHNSPIDAVVELQNSAGAVLPDVGYKVTGIITGFLHYFTTQSHSYDR